MASSAPISNRAEVGKERERTRPAKMVRLQFLVRHLSAFSNLILVVEGPSSFTGQVNGNGTILQSPINTNVSTGTVQLRSPEYGYTSEVGHPLSTPPNNIGLVTTAPPVAQYNLDGSQRTQQNGTNTPRDAISAFFFYFYNSHPFCLPRSQLLELFKERRAPLLEFAVQYIGSSFLPAVPTELYEQALERSILNHNYPKDGFSLQALMLYAIGLHANNKVPRAGQIFGMAQAMCLELGIHRSEFAMLNGNNDRVLEECWRRTWWSMYTVNGMMAAVNPGVQFRLKDIVTDVPLPCENHQYFSGVSNFSTHLQSSLLLFPMPSLRHAIFTLRIPYIFLTF